MNKKKPKDRLNVTLSEEHKERLEKISKSFRISKSAIIEILLACFLASDAEKDEAQKRVDALRYLLK